MTRTGFGKLYLNLLGYSKDWKDVQIKNTIFTIVVDLLPPDAELRMTLTNQRLEHTWRYAPQAPG